MASTVPERNGGLPYGSWTPCGFRGPSHRVAAALVRLAVARNPYLLAVPLDPVTLTVAGRSRLSRRSLALPRKRAILRTPNSGL